MVRDVQGSEQLVFWLHLGVAGHGLYEAGLAHVGVAENTDGRDLFVAPLCVQGLACFEFGVQLAPDFLLHGFVQFIVFKAVSYVRYFR